MLSHYRLVEKIGEGGMGVVWKAFDTKLDRHVAIKLLPPELTTDPDRRRRFLREARAAAAVTHPNIVAIHEIDDVDGITFLCMELVEGRTLRSVIDGRPMAIPEILGVASEIAEGLARAHQDGIVHRDLKPDNIILGADGHPKILDFGLAKLVEQRQEALRSQLSRQETRSVELTGERMILGTPAYMSPEQARGGVVDARSDIFSFGVVLYEMATRRAPFRGDSQIETLAAILHEPAVPASRLNPEVPSRLDEFLGRCLEKDPRRRYQTSRELVAELRQLGRDLAAGGLPSRGETRGLWAPARRPWRAAFLLGAILFVAGGALLLLRPARQAPGTAKTARERSAIAVLPFQNLSAEASQSYFAGGLHDELLTQLSKVAALKVISRTSVMGYQGTAKPLRLIGEELGVASLVEGSVQVVGDRLRVNVQLIDAATDAHLWAERYDRTLDDAFAIQSEVAQRIVAAVGGVLTDTEQGRLTAVPTASAEAYRLYLKGRYFAGKMLEEETQKGIRCFEQALELDPGYAAAHAGLAIAYSSLSVYGRLSPRDVNPKARDHAMKALQLDPSSASAYTALGRINMLESAWDAAEEGFKRAIALGSDADAALVHDNYAFVLMYLGRMDEAVAQIKAAVAENPISVGERQNLGEVLYYARRYDESIAASLEAIDMDPAVPQAHLFLGMAYAAQGRLAEAVAALDRAKGISGGKRPEVERWIGVGYALAGQADRARRIYDGMIRQTELEFVSPFPLACMCFLLGEVDRGFEWLSEGFEQHDPRMSFLKVHPACDVVRTDPRYLGWLRKMGLEE